MKKTKCMIILLIAILVTLLLGSTVMAKNIYKIVNLKAGKTVNMVDYVCQIIPELNERTDTYYQYKMVIPADGYITINIKADHDTFFYIYKKKITYDERSFPASRSYVHNDLYDMTLYTEGLKNWTRRISLGKGTYYIRTCDDKPIEFRYSFSKASFPANYCWVKAQSLPRGKKVIICQTPKKDYSRWFKIKLTKKQAITFWSDQGDKVTIYDSYRDIMDIKHKGNQSIKYVTSKKLPKGTYYLRMSSSYLDTGYIRYYFTTLSWK